MSKLSKMSQSNLGSIQKFQNGPFQHDFLKNSQKVPKMRNFKREELRHLNKSVDLRQIHVPDFDSAFPKIRLRKYDDETTKTLSHHPSSIKLLKNLKIEEKDIKNQNFSTLTSKTIALKPIVDWNLRQIDPIKPRRKMIVVQRDQNVNMAQ